MAPDDALSRRRHQVDDYLGELAQWRARSGSGREVEEPVAAIRARHRAFGDRELFQHTSEAVRAVHADPDEPRRLAAFRAFLAEEQVVRAAQDATDEISLFEHRASVPLGEEALSFRAAQARLPRESSRVRRDQLEDALGGLLFAQTAPYARRVEGEQRVAERLGFPSARALFEETTGIALGPLAEDAALTLRKTEDAYRDLLGYFLKKLDATARPLPGSGARRHDLLHLSTGAAHAELFRPEDLWRVVAAQAAELGLPPDPDHHLRVETEQREGMARHPFTAELKVPGSIQLVVPRGFGLDGLTALLRALGQAEEAAYRSPRGTVEERRLADRSINLGFGTLFERFATDERYLRRAFELPASTARDVARLAAFNALTQLRSLCALLPYELTLMARGAADEVSDEYEERQRQALFVPAHRGFFLFEHRPFFERARQLRGHALEAVLQDSLRERFNEDFFRNPAAGRQLRTLFAFAGQGDAAALAESLGGKLELVRAGARLVRVLNG